MAEPKRVWDEVGSLVRRIFHLSDVKPFTKSGPLDKSLMQPTGRAKGPGWLGPLPMTGDHEGSYMTEVSRGVPTLSSGTASMLAGQPPGPFYPLLTPNQLPGDVSWLLSGGSPTPEMEKRAREHYEQQRAKGQSPWAPGVALPHPSFKPKPNPKYPPFEMMPLGGKPVYLPGNLDQEVRQDAGYASDDPYQMGATYEAWKKRKDPRSRP